jgi:hypothetical protein
MDALLNRPRPKFEDDEPVRKEPPKVLFDTRAGVFAEEELNL